MTIDYNTLTRLVLKIFGMGLIVYGAVSLSAYMPELFRLEWKRFDAALIASYIFSLTIPFLCGAFLWFFPATIANTVVRIDPEARNFKTGRAEELERVGVSLLGLYLLYRSVSDIVYLALKFRAEVNLNIVHASDSFALLTSTLVEFGLALLMLLRSERIVALLRKVRGR